MNHETARLLGMELRMESSGRWGGVYFHGDTMRPFLRDGDEVVIEPVSWQDVRIGQIVTYRHLDLFPTRRITEHHRLQGRFILKGDGMPLRRFFRAQEEDITGRVVARKRGSKVLTNRDFSWHVAAWRALFWARVDRLYRKLRRALGKSVPASNRQR